MQIIDITMELSERVPIFASDPRVHLKKHATLAEDGYAVTHIEMGSHSGTHMDAPCHLLPGGKTVVEASLNKMIGPCRVVDTEDFQVPRNTRRLLIRDRSGREETINLRQAEALIDAGVQLVGTDRLSIGNEDVHRLLLASECIIIESLDLTEVEPGSYILCALPLKVNCDGAPVRACLMPHGKS